MYISVNVFFIALYAFSYTRGLEYNKQQRYNPNTDFLLHEAGGNTVAPKKDYTASQSSKLPVENNQNNYQTSSKRDYVAQFPALRPPSSPQRTLNPPSQSNHNPQSSSGKRDYVSNQHSTTRSTISPNLSTPSKSNQNPQSSSGNQDYMAPQYPPLKPAKDNGQDITGKVKDLVNYYENKGKERNPQHIPSYSSILQGSGGNKTPSSTLIISSTTGKIQPVTQSPQKPSLTTNHISYSSIVTGSNKPQSTLVTSKPTTIPSRPEAPVLPSSTVNNNKHNNQNNNISGLSDVELQAVSEELLRKDTNNAAKYITINYQGKTTSQSKDDKAPEPLLTIAPEVWNISTIQKFVPLLDNYERDTLVNEYVTPQERNEENSFMDTIMTTSVIRHLMNYFKDKGYVTPDPKQQRDFLKQLWFSLYSRGKGKISSSGFEHVFVSELKNGEVSGLHNWIYFSKEESANRVNYLGYLKYAELNDKGVVMKLHFNQQGVDKPVDSMFIGTSPELEIALYTLCFVTRADNDCKLKLGGKDIEIVTHTFRYRSKNLIGSAYPQI